jgi:hypothetical protein
MPRRPGKSGGKSGGAPGMMARATAQASHGASALFAHLDGADSEDHALVLERLAKRIRAGEWTADLADLVTRAQQVEETLAIAIADE